MEFTVKQLFSIVDGRLSTEMGDVYSILDTVTGESLMTHQLPTATRFIKQLDPLPDWWLAANAYIHRAKLACGEDFNLLMEYIDAYCSFSITVNKLLDEQMTGFGEYMVDNSLLKQIGKGTNS